MGCQVAKAALPTPAQGHGKTLLQSSKKQLADGHHSEKWAQEERHMQEPQDHWKLEEEKQDASPPQGLVGRLREDAECDDVQIAGEEDSLTSHPVRKLSMSADSWARPASTSAGGRSVHSSSFSTPTASARSSLSRATRTSWARGHVQEEGASPQAMTPSALTARRLVTEQCLPEATPRVQCPETLYLVAPLRPALQGTYCRVPEIVANSEPIWRQQEGEGWLFSCSTGFWMVGDHRDKVERNLAQLRTMDRHYAKLPHECHKWMYGEDSRNWVSDSEGPVILTSDRERALLMVQKQGEQSERRILEAHRRAEAAPDNFWLAAPPKPNLQGEYRKVPDRMYDDMPVWRQVNGVGLLLSTAGHWVVLPSEHVDDVRAKTQIRSSVMHGGGLPHEVTMWKYSSQANRGWATDYVRAICISRDSSIAQRSQANYMCIGEDFGEGVVESNDEELHSTECDEEGAGGIERSVI
mmetsp:Transcript_47243/g.109298  ORF Transcript_47243/g.109298 Transcript_47243/m.109298 type:complete len:468 (+) Transcript_47243:59-1462(+)